MADIKYKKLQISKGLWFEYYEEEWGREMTVEYIEAQYDSYYSDSQESVDLTKEKAKEIVELLTRFFNL